MEKFRRMGVKRLVSQENICACNGCTKRSHTNHPHTNQPDPLVLVKLYSLDHLRDSSPPQLIPHREAKRRPPITATNTTTPPTTATAVFHVGIGGGIASCGGGIAADDSFLVVAA